MRAFLVCLFVVLAGCTNWGTSLLTPPTPMPIPTPPSGYAHHRAQYPAVPAIYVVNAMPQWYLVAITPTYPATIGGCKAYLPQSNPKAPNIINQRSEYWKPPPAPGVFVPNDSGCSTAVIHSYYIPDGRVTCTLEISGMTATMSEGIDALCRLIHNVTERSYTLIYLTASHAHTFPPL